MDLGKRCSRRSRCRRRPDGLGLRLLILRAGTRRLACPAHEFVTRAVAAARQLRPLAPTTMVVPEMHRGRLTIVDHEFGAARPAVVGNR